MFFETIGLAVCSCALLGMAAGTSFLALVNAPVLLAGGASLMRRLRWLLLGSAPVAALDGIVAA